MQDDASHHGANPHAASSRDPLAAAKYRAEHLAQQAEAQVKRIADAPAGSNPPAVPELLTRPVIRPPSMAKSQTTFGQFAELSKGLAIGLDFLFTLIAGGVIGYLIDRWQGWAPIGMLVGGGVGFLLGVVRLLKRLQNADKASKKPPSK